MKGNILQSDDAMVPNIRVQKFQIDPKKFEKFSIQEVLWTVMRLKKSQRRMITILIMVKSPHS